MNPSPRHFLESQIAAVTVYTDRALITRRGAIALNGDETEIVLPHLPLTLDTQSVRVQGSGEVPVQLLGVRTERAFATEPVAERVADLTAQIRDLENQRRSLTDQHTALTLQRSFVEQLGQQSVGRFAQGLARQQTGLDQTRDLLQFLGQQYGDFSGAIAQQQQHLEQLDQRLNVLRQELQQISNPLPQESYTLRLAIAPSGAGQLVWEVKYVCDRAGWLPLYDFRLDTTSKQLFLTYQAQIQQTTGENWEAVDLTLSTAKPGLGSLPPTPDTWFLDMVAPPVPAMARSAMAPSPVMMDTLESFEFEATMLMPSPKMEMRSAQINREGGVVTFQAGGGNRVPSDGGWHNITLLSEAYPIRLEHIAMPKQVSFAYLQAVVSNPSTGVTLLPGSGNIFRDEMFVGTSPIDNVAPGQEFRLNLGIDESLKIEREQIEREVDKKLIGGQRRIAFGYRIRIENLNPVTPETLPITLKLIEQLPVSRNEQIKVRLIRSTPTLQPGEMGTLEWTLVIPPRAKQEISYQFTVEHPPNLKIVGLDE